MSLCVESEHLTEKIGLLGNWKYRKFLQVKGIESFILPDMYHLKKQYILTFLFSYTIYIQIELTITIGKWMYCRNDLI